MSRTSAQPRRPTDSIAFGSQSPSTSHAPGYFTSRRYRSRPTSPQPLRRRAPIRSRSYSQLTYSSSLTEYGLRPQATTHNPSPRPIFPGRHPYLGLPVFLESMLASE